MSTGEQKALGAVMEQSIPPLPEPLSMSMLASSSDREFTAAQMRAFYQQGVEDERERCAVICETRTAHYDRPCGVELAALIRKG
jgi:hypothetical protein